MNTLLMFDLDGTLLDTSQLFFEGVPRIVHKHLGFQVSQEEILSMWGQIAKNMFLYFASKVGVGDERLINRMYTEFERFYVANHDDMFRVYDDIIFYLPRLKEKVLRIGVVTARPRSRTNMIYSQSWSKYIDFIVCGDDVQHPKPAPEGLELAIERFGGVAHHIIYVGDNWHDIQAAKNCRYPVMSIAGLWGAYNHEVLLNAEPDMSFSTFQDFSEWILTSE